MTTDRNSTSSGRRQLGPVTLALMAMRNDGEVKRSKRVIPPSSVGAGFVVICRDPETGKLKRFGCRPYEHATEEEALQEAERLTEQHGRGFDVFRHVAGVSPPQARFPAIEITDEADPPSKSAEPAPLATDTNRRRVYHAADKLGLPTFRINATLCARRTTILKWIAKQESAA